MTNPRPVRVILWALAAVAVGAMPWLLGRAAAAPIADFARWIDGLGPLAPFVFAIGYAVATIAMLPGSIFSLAAGAIFGLGIGMVAAFAGAFIGAASAFLVARHLARPAIERRLAGDSRVQRLDDAVGREGLKVVMLLRLTPVVPFNLLNPALGLTHVRFADYLLGTVAILPGTFLYVYYGAAVGELAAVLSGAGIERGTAYYVMLAVGLIATLAVTIIITRIARRALARDADSLAHVKD